MPPLFSSDPGASAVRLAAKVKSVTALDKKQKEYRSKPGINVNNGKGVKSNELEKENRGSGVSPDVGSGIRLGAGES
jgi:hypothetical protein